MKKLLVAVVALSVLGAIAGPALASKDGKGGGSSDGLTGTIELDASTARLRDIFAWPHYGDEVGFRTSVEGHLSPRGYVYVRVLCWQEGRVVYQWSADPAFLFPLVDQAGQGLEWDGGAASCTGELIYRIDGRHPEINFLAQVPFDVGSA